MVWFALPLATAAISGAFALAVFRRFLEKKKRHNLLWSLGLFAIMGAALAQLIAELSGYWPEGVYRAYYWMAGVGPATLGAGTVYLLKNERLANYFLYAVAVLAAIYGVLCTVSPIDVAHLSAAEVESGVKAAAPAMRVFIAILGITGTVALLGGAVLSFRATHYIHNLFIAAGAAVFASGGFIAGLFPHEGGLSAMALSVGNLIGIVLLFLGFWLARTPQSEPVASAVAIALVARPPP